MLKLRSSFTSLFYLALLASMAEGVKLHVDQGTMGVNSGQAPACEVLTDGSYQLCTSGTCEGHGFERISNADDCKAARSTLHAATGEHRFHWFSGSGSQPGPTGCTLLLNDGNTVHNSVQNSMDCDASTYGCICQAPSSSSSSMSMSG